MRSYKRGLTILEIIVATLVFALAAIPLYRAITKGAAREIDSTKLSMARKILESLREELKARSFDDVARMVGGTTMANLEGGYPNTLNKVLNVQRQYKDFALTVQARFASPDSVIEVRGSTTWTSAGGTRTPEELTFLIIRP